MFDDAALRRALREAGLPDGSVRYDEVTESTNATALAMAADGAPEWTLVAADQQTAGRGRLGRTWVSEPGALLFSIVLRPRLPPDRATFLTLLAGTATASACDDVGVDGVRCKWPNDLVTGDGKVGGILTESRVADGEFAFVVVGIGLNVATPKGVEGAASVAADRVEVLEAFLRRLERAYRPSAPEFAREVLAAYRSISATLGRRVRATRLDGGTVVGTAVDLDELGNLLVESGGRRETIGFGEVEHLR